MTALARTASLALLTFALAGIGCGQQDESHTNTGPESNASAPTPATATATATETTVAPTKIMPEVATAENATATPKPSPIEPAPASTSTSTSTSENADGAVTLEKVNYDTFLKRVAANPNKPKYTIVDAWATWCGPCKENFPHLVEMNRKYGDKGMAFASMSFDDPAEKKQVADANAFLREKKATFTNYLLDEEPGVGFEKFGVNAIPAVFIYGPDGKEVKRFTMDDPNNQFTYDEVEKTVVALLEAK